jgi:hypothetical protein
MAYLPCERGDGLDVYQREDTEYREAAEYFREVERMGYGREEGMPRRRRSGLSVGAARETTAGRWRKL